MEMLCTVRDCRNLAEADRKHKNFEKCYFGPRHNKIEWKGDDFSPPIFPFYASQNLETSETPSAPVNSQINKTCAQYTPFFTILLGKKKHPCSESFERKNARPEKVSHLPSTFGTHLEY